ncbi:MAG: potassium/proton antiporter [Rhodospirillaceae bacterium]|nr:potassium/proton antiporter [Rhodospirillaceae bacterium]
MDSIAVSNTLLLFGATLILLGIFSSLIATRFGAPLLLVFLVIGMLAGEDGPGGLMFSDYQLTYIIGSLALAVILFDGGLRTNIKRLRGAIAPAAVLATVGVVLTAGLTGLAAVYLFDLPPLYGVLLGAIVASTDAAAVFFLIHAGGLQLKRRVNSVLEVESGTNDPVAVFMTLVLVQFALAAGGQFDLGDQPVWQFVAVTFLQQAAIGTAGGAIGGLAASAVLNRVTLPGGLHPLMVIAVAVLIYALTAVLDGSGFLAVYIAGLILGNRPLRASASIVTVNDAATWLCQIVMFLVLGLLVTPSKLLAYAVPAILLAVFLTLVARPAAVFLCLAPFRFSFNENLLVSWIGLRGAVSIFLAAIPMLAGVDYADVYFNVAFVVVLCSLVVQGWSLTFVARKLGLAIPRKGAEVRRVELDIPGQLAREIVGYPVLPDSAVVAGAPVPGWAIPAFVVRDQQIITPDSAGALAAGDYAYFLAPQDRLRTLDQLFVGHSELLAHDDPFFGEFDFSGDVKLGDMTALYGLAPDPADAERSLNELFRDRFDGKPEVGDNLPVAGVVLVARQVDNDQVVRVGLQFGALGNERPWLARLRKGLRWRRATKPGLV